ncbi:uncharacterized protein LOC122053489 isoform X2 [Zingiber officinale]|uniref:Uncharacterized protein n=1 Tax=Zingiber officinale TaxID=94328 RepID=A0A8J5LNE2_ZINOF|nr:uncharacterized protein LOC122053489 isoform X2 [Zingiber officinale]KAG6519855.1 hypothetical protein ZIOFF_016883 [Zingiber officinale]
MEMSSIKEAKRDLITLDLLGGVSPAAGAQDVADVSLKAPSFGCHHHPLLRPLDLNQMPEDVVRRKQAAGLFAGGGGQSVCTIERVRMALERAGRESQGERRLSAAAEAESSVVSPSGGSASSTSSSSITTASAKRRTAGVEDAGGPFLVVAGCSGCLSYVLIEKDSLRCPRCESQTVAATTVMTPPAKRPRVDLEFKMGL